MSKDLNYLNSQWWYRLVKVLYILMGIAAFIFAIFAPYSNDYPDLVNNKISLLQCQNGLELPLSEAGFHLKKDKISDELDQQITRFCSTHVASSPEQMTHMPVKMFPDENYYIFVAYKHNWQTIIIGTIVTLAVVALIWEAIRRIFYYIILGTFTPKKHE